MAAVFCCEDRRNPAVCCCFCRFPLPVLCEEHLSAHPLDEDCFEHFHLPLHASQRIDSIEKRTQFFEKLFRLHSACTALKSNEQDIARLEEQIETARCGVLQDFEADVAQAKARVAALRHAFKAEVQKARTEISLHALEEWQPESGSLSAHIWSNSSAKLFRLRVGKLSQGLPISIESLLPGFAVFNQQAEEDKHHCEEFRRENEKLREQITDLELENEDLRADCSKLSAELEAFRVQSDAQVKRLSEELAQVTAAYEEVAPYRSEYEKELRKRIASRLDRGLLEKEGFQYKESAHLLQEAWSLLHKFGIKEIQTVAVGAVLAEVLGLHVARAAEAIRVIEICRQIQTASGCSTEEMLNLRSLKAVVYYLDGQFCDAETVCRDILQELAGSNADAKHYWTALYFLTYALYERDKINEATALIAEGIAKSFVGEDELTHLLKLSLQAKLAVRNGNNQEAEKLHEEARRLAAIRFPTSIYAALNLYELGRLHFSMERKDEGLTKYLEARRVADSHYPGSWVAYWILYRLTFTYNEKSQYKVALSLRLDAHRVLSGEYPCGIATPLNLTDIAQLHKELKQPEAALQKRLEAQALFETHHPTHIYLAYNLTGMADAYFEMKQMEIALQKRMQAHRLFEMHMSTDIELAHNLIRMADAYEELKQHEAALRKREEAHRFLEAHHKRNKLTAINLEKLAKLSANLGLVQEAERACIESRAHWVSYQPTDISASFSLHGLGELCEGLGKTEAALACAESALEIATAMKDSWDQERSCDLLARLKKKKK